MAAYDQLLALGLVDARKQRGFFVREAAPDGTRRAAHAARPPAQARHPLPLSATALIRGMFQPPGARPMPGLGTLPADWLDLPLLAGALRKVTPRRAARRAVAALRRPGRRAAPAHRAVAPSSPTTACSAAAEQIVTTVGATHALDIVTRTLLRAGDSVLVDEPGWSVEYARLAALGMRVLPVPRGEDGPDLRAMERLIDAQKPHERPRLYVTVSVLHNPTGASLSLQAAHRVLQLAQAHDLHIVEDDTYAHLAPAHLPRLAALDALERTIYVSGFSKILVPNWRVGFLAAPAALVDRLVDTKLLTTLTTPGLTEQALAHCLEQGLLRRHAERVMAKLDAARARAVKLAEAHGCRFAAPPRGLFGWVDVGVDTERLAGALLDDWLIAPGALFHAVPPADHADAHQLRDHPGRALLARAGAGARRTAALKARTSRPEPRAGSAGPRRGGHRTRPRRRPAAAAPMASGCRAPPSARARASARHRSAHGAPAPRRPGRAPSHRPSHR